MCIAASEIDRPFDCNFDASPPVNIDCPESGWHDSCIPYSGEVSTMQNPINDPTIRQYIRGLIENFIVADRRSRVRPGPGRRSSRGPTSTIGVRLPDELVETLDALPGGASRNWHVERAVAFYVAVMGEDCHELSHAVHDVDAPQ